MSQKESDIQIELAAWINTRWPDQILWTAGLGGLRLTPGQAIKIKRMGYKNGTPDIMIFEPRVPWHGLFIELKRDKGTASEAQCEFQRQAMRRRYLYEICYGLDEAKEIIHGYLGSV